MLTRIEIDGFKSFRDFAIDCEPFLAVVGPNSAGKSNLFDALRLLSRLAREDLYSAFQGGRGRVADQFMATSNGAGRRISMAVELLLPPEDGSGAPAGIPHMATRIRYELTIERTEGPSGLEELGVVHERVSPLQEGQDPWIRQHPAFAPLAQYQTIAAPHYLYFSAEKDLLSALSYTGSEVTVHAGSSIRDATLLSGRQRAAGQTEFFLSKRLAPIGSELDTWRFLHLDALKLHLPSERAATRLLAPDGANLPTALAALPPEAIAQIQVDLAELVPGLSRFEVVRRDDEFEIEIEFTDGRRLPARVLSDGTLRILAYLTLLRTPGHGGVFGLEEPENGIYPGRLRSFLHKLQAATNPPPSDGGVLQIFVNSHSPTVLATLRRQPEALLFADMIRQEDGLRATRMRRVIAGASPDRGATTVSRREIERLLETAIPAEE